jgi:Cdc6-like AAA superfamily ATPase
LCSFWELRIAAILVTHPSIRRRHHGRTDPARQARRDRCDLLPALANRHGLITGATGTGKTITLQTIAETCRASACRCSWPT